ncbi:MAG TPA: hypothetical protein IAB56_00130 [Candidatus Scybalousia intestinigallinarum]|nr:hypothetical protein [Candidatus Scybalousia intestinigallinarum]
MRDHIFLTLWRQILSKYTNIPQERQDSRTEQPEYRDKRYSPVVLDDKVDKFIEWYNQNEVKEKQTAIGEYRSPIEMRNFIETLAVWYELRYPDIFIDSMIFAPDAEDYQSTVMFKKNPYMMALFGNSNPVGDLDWTEFYNFQVLLPFLGPEKIYLQDIPYPRTVDIKVEGCWFRLWLSEDGVIQMIENFGGLEHNRSIVLQQLEQFAVGKSAKEFVQFMADNHVPLADDNPLTNAILDQEKYQYLKKELFNCVMYRIIERGKERIGPRRAYLFANEFGCDKSIPITYGIDLSDPNLEQLLRIYLSDGGSLDLVCYLNYFRRTSKYQALESTTVRELLRFFPDLESYIKAKESKKSRIESGKSPEQAEIKPQKVISYFRQS